MKNMVKLVEIIVIVAVIGFTSAGCDLFQEELNEANGDWKAKKVIREKTDEAELMVRVGDIDTLNYNIQPDQHYAIFEKNSLAHGIGWELDPLDPMGTDRIYVGTAWTSTSATPEGYSQLFSSYKAGSNPYNYAFGDGALEITMEYGEKIGNITVKNARLDIAADDFQKPRYNSNFTVTLNGRDAPFIATALNNLDQSGPICELVSLNVPASFLPEIQSGTLVIKIDETTGVGDGYAIDFVKLLINLRK